MDQKEAFSKKLVYAKFVLSLMIVMIHVINYQPLYHFDSTWYEAAWGVVLVFGQMGVPCYFVISGFLFFSNYRKSKLTDKYKRRVKTLVIPYLFWNTAILMVYFMYDRLGIYHEQGFAFTPISICKEILYCSYFSPLWFIRTLVVYMLVCPIIVYTWRNQFIAVIEVLFISLSVYYKQTPIISNYYMGIFLMGAYLAIYHREKTTGFFCKTKKKPGYVMMLFTVIFSITLYGLGSGYSLLYTFRWTAVFSFFFIVDIIYKNKIFLFMRYGFPLYCLHGPVVRLIKCIGDHVLSYEMGGVF